jgi:MipA family protein
MVLHAASIGRRDKMRSLVVCLVALSLAPPAFAQDVAPPRDAPRKDRDTVTIGVGAIVSPRYEGANDYRIMPGGSLRGKVSGVAFATVGTALVTDIIPSAGRDKWKFVFGPVARLRLSRSSLKTIRDPQIVALGKIPVTVELGAQFGLSKTGVVTSPFDNFIADVAVTHDVGGVHDSLLVTPSISYGTPLSRKAYVGVSASATHVGRGYAQRYFGVTAPQAVASGLAASAPGSGFKDVAIGALANYALTGDLRKGLSLFAIGSGSRLLGDFARSPIVRARTQWFGGLGLAYSF